MPWYGFQPPASAAPTRIEARPPAAPRCIAAPPAAGSTAANCRRCTAWSLRSARAPRRLSGSAPGPVAPAGRASPAYPVRPHPPLRPAASDAAPPPQSNALQAGLPSTPPPASGSAEPAFCTTAPTGEAPCPGVAGSRDPPAPRPARAPQRRRSGDGAAAAAPARRERPRTEQCYRTSVQCVTFCTEMYYA